MVLTTICWEEIFYFDESTETNKILKLILSPISAHSRNSLSNANDVKIADFD